MDVQRWKDMDSGLGPSREPAGACSARSE